MKNKVIFIIASLILFLVASCDKEDYNANFSFFRFERDKLTVKENAGIIDIKVLWSKSDANTAGNLEFEVSTEGLEYPAKEGVNFEVVSKTVKFEQGEYFNYLKIKIIDDNLYELNKSFKIRMKSTDAPATLGNGKDGISELLVTIADNNDPRTQLIGKYVFSGIDIQEDDKLGTYDVNIVIHPTEMNKIYMTNFSAFNDLEIIYEIKEGKEYILTIPSSQLALNMGWCILKYMACDYVNYNFEFFENTKAKSSIDKLIFEFDNGLTTVAYWPNGDYLGMVTNIFKKGTVKLEKVE